MYGDNNLIAMDATFGTNKYKFHLYTILVFDAHRNGVPVAWVLTSSATMERHKFLQLGMSSMCLSTCACGMCGDVGSSILLESTSEVETRERIQGMLASFFLEYHGEEAFVEYFKTYWLSKIDMWVRAARTLPH
ncbi:hypothetical protein GOP47_0026585 [Adiantum capillus-veneris]|nr:hypothetical protein GOP47_0026585 [Adiantum capillus-veneris]